MSILSPGTSDDISQIVDKYFDTVYKVTLSITKNVQNAEDSAQDVFLKLIKSDKTFESEEHLKAWLLRVAVNTSKSVFSGWYFKNTAPLDNALHKIAVTDDSSEILDVIMALPEKYRIVIHLYYYEGYSTKEIAKIVKKSDGYVYTVLHRGRKILREKLEGRVDFE